MAVVAAARRGLLLHAHRHRLRLHDLEDCYSQATLELVVSARAGRAFQSHSHVANSLELRFLSRVRDRRRALGGRSPIQAAMETASQLSLATDRTEMVDAAAQVERRVIMREELERVRSLAQRLSDDQRLVLAAQVGEVGRAEICRQYGWSEEKYRKVAQRARARLRRLVEEDEAGVPPAA